MRLVFLDFDGVLHPVEPASLGLTQFCWLHILSQLLVGHDDVRLIVHSTWRYEYKDAELRAFLGPLGNRWASPRFPDALPSPLNADAPRIEPG